MQNISKPLDLSIRPADADSKGGKTAQANLYGYVRRAERRFNPDKVYKACSTATKTTGTAGGFLLRKPLVSVKTEANRQLICIRSFPKGPSAYCGRVLKIEYRKRRKVLIIPGTLTFSHIGPITFLKLILRCVGGMGDIDKVSILSPSEVICEAFRSEQ